MSYYQKRIMILEESRTTTYYIENENNNIHEKTEIKNENILLQEIFV